MREQTKLVWMVVAIACAGAVILLFVTWLVTPARALVIRNDPGGDFEVYADRVAALRRSGEPVIIDGPCDSACTMYLALSNVCATKRASFLFHTVFDKMPAKDRALSDRILMRFYPPRVRAWVKANGGLRKRPLISSLNGIVRRC